MKKLKTLCILIILSIFVSNVSYADSTNVNKTQLNTLVSTDTSLNKQIYNDFKSGISAIATALKVGVSHVYEVLIKQQVVYSIIYIVIILFFITVGILLYRQTFKLWFKEEWKKSDSPRCVTIYVFLGIDLIIITCNLLFFTEKIVTGFINPEYGAMQEIINFVK